MFKKLIYLVIVLLAAGSVSAALPAGWTGLDIANPVFDTPGTSAEAGGTWTLTASGNDMWGNDDEFHYCYTTMRGDGELVARVASITGGTDAWQKAGVMIRKELVDTSIHAQIIAREAARGGSFQWRPVAGAGSSSSNYGDPDIPIYIKIVRVDNSFSGYTSPDGVVWTQQGNSVELDMGLNVYIGLSLTSHNRAEITTATYDNMQFSNPGLNQAVFPDPANGAMVSPSVFGSNVFISLDYTPGDDAVSYTGYFSDSFDDVSDRVAGANLGSPPWPGISETAFTVGFDDAAIPEFARAPLERGKTYYWAVDIWDGTKNNPGKVWSFTVKPDKAFDPVPSDGAVFIPIDPNVTVSWTMGDVDTDGNTVSYEVFYGTDAGAVAAATVPNMTVLSASAEIGPLANGTVYAWRIDTVLTATAPPFGVKKVAGDVWEFETLPVIPITDPNLQGWWKFDVGSGTTAIDWSGHGRDGTLIGPSPQWVPGILGNALEFDGSNNSYVNIDGYKGVLGTSAFSVAAWVKSTATNDRTIMSWGTGTSRERVDFRLFQGRLRVEHGAGNRQGDTVLSDGEWHHVALTIAENATISYPEVKLWLDGQDDTRGGTDPDVFNLIAQHDLGIGIRVHNDSREFLGALDDVRLYNKELTAGEITQIMDPARAWDPSPADGEKEVALGSKLSWKAGTDPDTGTGFTTHHLYFSANFEDVNSESVTPIVLEGVTEHSPLLEYYGRHFWKINEVGGSVVKGNIWTFKVTHDPSQVVDPNLRAWYKLDGDGSDSSGYGNHAEASIPASYVASDDGQALQLFGDNFLEAVDYTGVTGTHSRTVAAWINTTTFGEIMTWGQDSGGSKWIFRVQESNGTLGAIRIEVSGGYIVGSFDVRDNEWHHVAAVLVDDGSPMVSEIVLYVDGVADSSSAVNDTSINTADASNVRIGKAPWGTRWFTGKIDDARIYDKALSEAEIQVLYRVDLSWAWNPSPRQGATGVARDADLSWTHGDGAAMSTVYFGADDPGNMVQVAGPQAGTTHDPGQLDLGTTYYWQIAEDNAKALNPGRIWKFTTTEYVVVDDMESYTPWTTPGNNIFEAWRDGEGNCDPGNGNDTGSILTEVMDPLFVRSDFQSMKYEFDNDGTVFSPCSSMQESGRLMYSRIEAQVAGLASGIGTDWTAGGVKALRLYFMGQEGNATTESLWAQLQDSSKSYGAKVFYGDFEGESLDDFNDASWHEWNIDLADFGVDLENVVSIVIGIGDEAKATAGGSGTLYFDDMRLYVPMCVPLRSSVEFAKVDLNSDCGIDYRDLDVLVGDWLEMDLLETGELLVRWEFNDASGVIATDSSGKDRHGNVNDTNGDSWVNDATRGWCLDFSGGDFVLDNDANAYMNGLSGLTIAVWVQNREVAATDQGFIIFADPAGNDNRGMRYDATGASTGGASVIKCGTFSAGPSGGIQEYESVPNTQVTVWQHLAMTWSSGNDVRLFINGVEDTAGALQATRTGTTSGYTKMLVGKGGKDQNASQGWNGLIDDVQVYNHPLTAGEIATVMGGGTIPPIAIHYPLTSPAEISADEDPGFRVINFKDYAELLNVWLTEELFPN